MRIPVQLQNPEFGFLKVFPREKTPVEKAWQLHLYGYGDPSFQNHIRNGGNYGVSSRNGLAVFVDADTMEIQDALDEKWFTFRYSTGTVGHYQYVFFVDKPSGNIKLKDGAYVKGKGGFAVGPGSVHPNGRTYGLDTRYALVQRIAYDDLIGVLKPFMFAETESHGGHKKTVGLHYVPDENVQNEITAFLKIWDKADHTRHDLTLAICGFLKRNGWPENAIQRVIDGLVEKTGKGHEHRSQVRYNYIHQGKEYGLPMISQIIKELGIGD